MLLLLNRSNTLSNYSFFIHPFALMLYIVVCFRASCPRTARQTIYIYTATTKYILAQQHTDGPVLSLGKQNIYLVVTHTFGRILVTFIYHGF